VLTVAARAPRARVGAEGWTQEELSRCRHFCRGSRALALDSGTVSARRRFPARWCCVTRDALAEAFTASGIEPRRVRMHHTYGLVDVPADRADDAVQALTGSDLAGRTLNVELAREQPAAA
jgi:hypothetical protein